MTIEPVPSLRTAEGELVCVRLAVEPRLLEELLEALAAASFPINPQIHHGNPETFVEFPAYAGRLDEVGRIMNGCGLPSSAMDVHGIFSAQA